MRLDREETQSTDYMGGRFGLLSQRGMLSYSFLNDPQLRQNKISLDSSIVFVGKHWGVTRPVRDSFMMFVPHKSIKNQTIRINDRVKSDRFGPGVIHDLRSYQENQISLYQADIPIGVDSLPSHYLKPSYGSGAVVLMGFNGSLIAEGTFVNETGQPLQRAFGTLTSLKDQEEKTFFSNLDGRFQLANILPGEYEIALLGYVPFRVHISETDQEKIKLGEFVMVRKEEEDSDD